MSKEETKNEQERMRVVLLLMVLDWLQPNDSTNKEAAKNNVVGHFIAVAKKRFGDAILTMADNFGVVMVDGKSVLCYSRNQSNPPPSDGALWRLVGQFFKDCGAKVGNLGTTAKKASGWTVGNRNAMAVKVLTFFGIGKGNNSSKFAWATQTNKDGKVTMPIVTMLTEYLANTSTQIIPYYEDLIDADDEEDVDEWAFETGSEITLQEDEFTVEVADAEIAGETGAEQLGNLRAHYNAQYNDTVVLHEVDLKSDAPPFLYGLYYSLMMLAYKATDPVLNLYYRKSVNSKNNSLYTNEEALKAISKGIGTEYSVFNKRKNETTHKIVADLRIGTLSTLLGRCSNLVLTSLHINVKSVYDFCSDLDISVDNFMAYGMRLIINTIENGGDADKLGYGFIQEIKRVGNYAMYEALMEHYGINLDGDDKHPRLFATMTKDSSSEKSGKWDNWEEDIIQ